MDEELPSPWDSAFNYHGQFCWAQRYQIILFLRPQIHTDTCNADTSYSVYNVDFFLLPCIFCVCVCVVLTLLLQLVPKGEKIRKDHYTSLGNCPPMLLLSQHEHLLLT